MNRVLVFLVVVGAFVTVSIDGGVTASGGGSGTQATMLVRSSILATLMGPCAFILAFGLSRKEAEVDSDVPVGIWRRAGAGCIDFSILFGSIFPVYALVMIMLEYFHTGEFRWEFQRNEFQYTDLLGFPLMLGVFTLMFLYFYKFATANKASVGQFVMGYKIIAQPDAVGPPNYFYRTLNGAFCSALWPIFLFGSIKKNKGVYVWDRDSNTRAVRVK